MDRVSLSPQVLAVRTPAADLLAKVLARHEQTLGGFLLIVNSGGRTEAIVGNLSPGELAVAVVVAQEDLRRLLFDGPARRLVEPAFGRPS